MIVYLCDLCGKKAIDWDRTTISTRHEGNAMITIENIEIKRTLFEGSEQHQFNVRPGHLCLKCTIGLLVENRIEQLGGEDGDQDQD